MKKTTALILILLTVLSLIMPKSYAVDKTSPSTLGEDLKETNATDIEQEMSDGTTSYTAEDKNGKDVKKSKQLSNRQDIGTNILRTITLILSFIPKVGNYIMQLAANTGGTFTIINLLSNKYDLFGINFWETDSDRNGDMVNAIRKNVSKWYIGVRNIASIIIMILLLYTGMRMAILMVTGNGSAKQFAQYKEMLVNWVISIVLIFIIHIMMIATIYVSNLFVSVIIKATGTKLDTNIETMIIDKTVNGLWGNNTTANHPVYFFICYCMLTYYEIKFFVVYLLRTFKIYFYIVISPIVCATYSLDKMNDGSAQGFQNWWTEFFTEVVKQPIQLLIFSIFVLSADEIFNTQPILFVIILALVSDIERIANSIIISRKSAFNKELKDVKVKDLVPDVKK